MLKFNCSHLFLTAVLVNLLLWGASLRGQCKSYIYEMEKLVDNGRDALELLNDAHVFSLKSKSSAEMELCREYLQEVITHSSIAIRELRQMRQDALKSVSEAASCKCKRGQELAHHLEPKIFTAISSVEKANDLAQKAFFTTYQDEMYRWSKSSSEYLQYAINSIAFSKQDKKRFSMVCD